MVANEFKALQELFLIVAVVVVVALHLRFQKESDKTNNSGGIPFSVSLSTGPRYMDFLAFCCCCCCCGRFGLMLFLINVKKKNVKPGTVVIMRQNE